VGSSDRNSSSFKDKISGESFTNGDGTHSGIVNRRRSLDGTARPTPVAVITSVLILDTDGTFAEVIWWPTVGLTEGPSNSIFVNHP
jgi:hypothetical protein